MFGLWTPPHFWSLALFRIDDYRSARVPMMPLVRRERVTKRQSAVYYAALLVGSSIALAWTRVVSARYLFIVVPLDLLFLGVTADRPRATSGGGAENAPLPPPVLHDGSSGRLGHRSTVVNEGG